MPPRTCASSSGSYQYDALVAERGVERAAAVVRLAPARSGGRPSAASRPARCSRAGRTCSRRPTSARARCSRGLVRKLYHSSSRVQRRRKPLRRRAVAVLDVDRRDLELLVDAARPGGRGSTRRRARRTTASRTRCRTPSGCRRSRRRRGCSARTPPAGSSLSTSPVVHSKITTSYLARFASVNASASSVASTSKPCCAGHLRDRGGALRDALGVPERGGLGEDQRAEARLVVVAAAVPAVCARGPAERPPRRPAPRPSRPLRSAACCPPVCSSR